MIIWFANQIHDWILHELNANLASNCLRIVSQKAVKFNSCLCGAYDANLLITKYHTICGWGTRQRQAAVKYFLWLQFNLSPATLGLIFVISGATYAGTAPFVGMICDRRVNPRVMILIGSVFTVLSVFLVGPAPFLPLDTWVPPLNQRIFTILLGTSIGFCSFQNSSACDCRFGSSGMRNVLYRRARFHRLSQIIRVS